MTFDEGHLVADAGLFLVVTPVSRLGLGALVDQVMRAWWVGLEAPDSGKH